MCEHAQKDISLNLSKYTVGSVVVAAKEIPASYTMAGAILEFCDQLNNPLQSGLLEYRYSIYLRSYG